MTDLERYYEAKEAYYNGEPIMTDLEFDDLECSLGLTNKSEIGARHNPSYTVQHPFIMGSLSKIQIKENQNGVVTWNDYFTELKRYIKDSNIPCIVSPKYDGCSFEVVVTPTGEIQSISSRGDGEYGKDLSKHLYNHVWDSVQDLYDQTGCGMTLRGEVLINKTTFEEKYSNFVNPRSFVSGILNRDFTLEDEFHNMLRDLSVVIYDIRLDKGGYWEDHDFRFYKFENKPSFYESQVIIDANDFSKLYKKFDTYRSTCEFALDGFVIKPIDSFRINNLIEHRPKDCVAIKFIPMLEETVVEEIIWSTRKTNELIPVIKVRPVIMDGKEVSRASAHNYGYLIDNKISVGTKVILSLAGDIIPFIYKVTDSSEFDIHKLCLNDTNTYIDGCHLYKQLSKEEIIKKRFMNSVSAMNIPNMGTAVAEKLYDYLVDNDLAEEYGDFFLIELKEAPENILLINMDDIEMGIGGKTGTSVRKAFEKIIKTLTLKDIILSLAIEDCGPKIAEQIEKQLLTRDADFSHMSEKAYKWVFDETSEEYNRVINILMKLNMSINDFKDKFIKETEKSSNQIPVILTGEPNNYTSKGEFLQCNPQYRLTGSWKEVKIVFTNSLDSNTGKMKKAREKNIEIQLY